MSHDRPRSKIAPMTADEETHTPAPSRVGSYADLALRIERVERRHETLEGEVRALVQTVSRVEQNQEHATELNKLRFDALDTGVKSIGGQLGDFTKRIEGILTGEVETVQGRQGQQLVAEYKIFHDKTLERLDMLEDHSGTVLEAKATAAEALVKATAVEAAAQLKSARQEGVVFALTGGKAVLLTLAAIAGPIIAVIALAIHP